MIGRSSLLASVSASPDVGFIFQKFLPLRLSRIDRALSASVQEGKCDLCGSRHTQTQARPVADGKLDGILAEFAAACEQPHSAEP